jgi:hypothetical protein
MTLNTFNFEATKSEASVYGAAISARVESGREAIEPTVKRAATLQPSAVAAA